MTTTPCRFSPNVLRLAAISLKIRGMSAAVTQAVFSRSKTTCGGCREAHAFSSDALNKY